MKSENKKSKPEPRKLSIDELKNYGYRPVWIEVLIPGNSPFTSRWALFSQAKYGFVHILTYEWMPILEENKYDIAWSAWTDMPSNTNAEPKWKIAL